MKLNTAFLPLLGLGTSLFALTANAQTPAAAAPTSAAPVAASAPMSMSAPAKVAVIDIQTAIIQTRDGQKAAGDLKTKFGPKQSELEKKQNDIAQLQDQLRRASNTMSEEAKQKIMRDIDQKNTSLKRDNEDAQADLEQEQQRIMGELGGKMISILNKYASDNGYALVLDISSQQTPVLFASNTIDITRDIIALYDKAAPTMTAPAQRSTAQPGMRPAAPRPAATSPAVPPKK